MLRQLLLILVTLILMSLARSTSHVETKLKHHPSVTCLAKGWGCYGQPNNCCFGNCLVFWDGHFC